MKLPIAVLMLVILASLAFPHATAFAGESIWIEAEDLRPIKGHYFPANLKHKSNGNWALSGPGVAAEWMQGGESGFLSIAADPTEDKCTVSLDIDVPVAGKYFVWVRYGDWREKSEPFSITLTQPGQAPQPSTFGEKPVIDEDTEMKVFFGWAFVWDQREVNLVAGKATLTLAALPNATGPRQLDAIVLTTDASYRPFIKDRPRNPEWDLLDTYRNGIPDLEPLARATPSAGVPDAWKLPLIKGKSQFAYLWNMDADLAAKSWVSGDETKVRVPYHIGDDDVRAEFEKTYAGKTDVPIFGDERVAPAFHGVGPSIFKTDPKTGEVNPTGLLFAKWLDAHPDRFFGGMMNYHPGNPIGPAGVALAKKYNDRYIGSIAGENIGYFYFQPETMPKATAGATTRRQLAEAFSAPVHEGNLAKYEKVFPGYYANAVDSFRDVISCMSTGNIDFAPLLADWGVTTIGFESTAATFVVINMRRAFMRGIARQRGLLTVAYRSSNFGDAATMFSKRGTFTGPRYVNDNYYDIFSGSGVNWYKFDLWLQYMAGSSVFYHEQGFDEFWLSGGGAFGVHPLELSPKGKLVDRFLRITKTDFDRGVPFTPVGVLVDYAHGWDVLGNEPHQFQNFQERPDAFFRDDHDAMMTGVFSTLYHPIGRESEKPITGTNETFLPGVFGDIFDVIAAYPDVKKWTTIDTYPVVIVAGEIELTDAEGKRLAQYIDNGGTLLVSDAHLTGPGAVALKLPESKEAGESDTYTWQVGERGKKDAAPQTNLPTGRFRFKVLDAKQGRVLASDDKGRPFCMAYERGKGELIYLAVPHAMTISKQMHPAFARLVAHLTRGLMPIDVEGDVTKLVNKNANGWMITLINPAGQGKPQHGMTPTDFHQNRVVKIRATVPIKTAVDRLLPEDKLTVKDNALTVDVPAGAVRVIELK